LKYILGEQDVEIVGVVSNYNFKSLHHEIEPLILSIEEPTNLNHLIVRKHDAFGPGLVAEIQAVYEEVYLEIPLSLRHYSEVINLQYEQDTGRMNLFMVLSTISIIMALIGFVGLTSYNIQKMTKQMMIRKVLGATYASRLIMLLKDKVIMAFIAMIIAIPLANYAFYNWLNSYYYLVGFSAQWTLLVLTFFILIILLIGVVLSQKTINSNPSELLREE